MNDRSRDARVREELGAEDIGMLDGRSANVDIRSVECRESGCGMLPHFWGAMCRELRRVALREQYHIYYNYLEYA